MTQSGLFLYMASFAGGLMLIGIALLLLYVLLVFVRGAMSQGDRK